MGNCEEAATKNIKPYSNSWIWTMIEIDSLVYPNYPIGVGGVSEVCRVVDKDACHWYIVPIHTVSEPIKVPLSCVRSVYP